ncbi:hypothetical protein ZIOFF_022720 [Zingiber officinale]|uniref:Uncharacterized protein n=1 Tax=Zingiber officinale TaxID=94328 RepID=A0A8J5LKC1_ZINOF|nr:hypothetical protein ZIOFF_022720 [Zingiber officinale]
MVSAQLWDWSRMEGLEVFNAWRSLSTHPKPHRIPLICSHGLYQPRPRRPWSTAKIKQHFYHLKMEGDLLSMASTQRLKLFQGSQAFPSNLHLHLLSKLGILRNLGDKESRRNLMTTEEQKQTRRTNTFYGPLESHWHFPEPEKKKPPLTSKLTFKAKQDGPVVLGWRHPWEGHGDHSHDHVPEDKIQFPYKMYVWIHGVDVRTSKICELGILNYRAKRVLWIALRQLEICVTMLLLVLMKRIPLGRLTDK